MTQIVVRTPSLARYWRLFVARTGKCNESVLRSLEYERLSAHRLTGLVLDFGGGGRTNYSDKISCWGNAAEAFTYHSANIDPIAQPTYVVGPHTSLPVEAETYDVVLSLNTFEHIYDLPFVFSEVHRILGPRGCFIFSVPFIFRVHGHPDDFMRGTPSFWSRFLGDHGFGEIAIEALLWGPFSTAQSVSGVPGPFKGLRRHFALLLDVLYFSMRHGWGITLTVSQDAPVFNSPLGYFIQAVKQ